MPSDRRSHARAPAVRPHWCARTTLRFGSPQGEGRGRPPKPPRRRVNSAPPDGRRSHRHHKHRPACRALSLSCAKPPRSKCAKATLATPPGRRQPVVCTVSAGRGRRAARMSGDELDTQRTVSPVASLVSAARKPRRSGNPAIALPYAPSGTRPHARRRAARRGNSAGNPCRRRGAGHRPSDEAKATASEPHARMERELPMALCPLMRQWPIVPVCRAPKRSPHSAADSSLPPILR